ncbi:hypothetical protein AB1046_05045 [Promicromonospora sp. Populi]|uniref:hypothetical protein n=1 Tax=Promicromonospora sp. Populi TaxID=3239420 RepID=UPI0034E22182
MQELVGRLTALDPEASETLKVVSYFDVLVAGGVGLQALLRGAAVLSGTVAGAYDGRRTHRVGPDGDRLTEPAPAEPAPAEPAPAEPAPAGDVPAGDVPVGDVRAGDVGEVPQGSVVTNRHWPTRPIADGSVWLEREGRPHANDEMVIERLALAVDLVGARRPGRPENALEAAIDGARDAEERRTALSRLRLDPAREVRIAALPVSHDVAGVPSTVVATPYGLVRAVLLGRDTKLPGPAGIGPLRPAVQLPESFRTAVLVLRLLPRSGPGSDSRSASVMDAADLGIVLAAVSALEPVAAQQPDVVALARLDARTRVVLDELAAAESVRAAATALGMHHSTLQARHEALTSELGYDPRSLPGRARFQLARLLLRLVDDHADR